MRKLMLMVTATVVGVAMLAFGAVSASAAAHFMSSSDAVADSGAAGPLSSDGFTCPSGQRLVLASVSYGNVVLTDTTNGVTANLPDVSRTFFSF
jgi:hypothetical protein